MGVVFIRTILLYLAIILALRLMGKRQIGEMQPTELVITLLIAEVASVPMQSNDIPMVYGLISIVVLVSLEVILSFLSLKSLFVREAISGRPSIIVENGTIRQREMRRQRFSLSDLSEELRLQRVNRLSDISYAVLETTGKLSLFLKPECEPVSKRDLTIEVRDPGIVRMLVSDGVVSKRAMQELSLTQEELLQVLQRQQLSLQEIYYLSVDGEGNPVECVRREQQ